MRGQARPSVVDSTVRVLREDIVDGRYRPGERLPEVAVMERFDVSRSTVREALQVLAVGGLVTLSPYRGARVSELSYDDALTLYHLRATVEPLLLERFCARATPAQLKGIDGIMLTMSETARTSDDLRRIYRASHAFYEALLEGAGSVPIAHAVRTEYARLWAFRRALLPQEADLERVRTSTGNVRRLVPAMARRDGRTVARFCRRAMVEDAAATLRLIRAAGG